MTFVPYLAGQRPRDAVPGGAHSGGTVGEGRAGCRRGLDRCEFSRKTLATPPDPATVARHEPRRNQASGPSLRGSLRCTDALCV